MDTSRSGTIRALPARAHPRAAASRAPAAAHPKTRRAADRAPTDHPPRSARHEGVPPRQARGRAAPRSGPAKPRDQGPRERVAYRLNYGMPAASIHLAARYAVFALVVVAALTALGSWVVRRRYISPFSALGRG